MEGDPKFDASQDMPDFPYARYAELIGLRGIRVDDPDAGRRRRGTRRSRPTGRSCSRRSPIPEVPPLPPHITFEQASHFAAGRRRRATPSAARHDRAVAAADGRTGSCPDGDGCTETARAVAAAASSRGRRDRGRPPTRCRRTRPESDGTAEWDATTMVARRGARRRRDRARLHLRRRCASGAVVRVGARGRRRGPRRDGGERDLGGDGAGLPQPRPSRRRVDGDRRRRHGAVGSEGAPARAAARDAARRGARRRCRSTAAAASPPTPTSGWPTQLGGWAAAGHPAREDEGRPRARARPRARPGRPRGDRRRHRAVRRRERRARRASRRCCFAERFAEHDVRWFEEPVSSDDLDGLRLLRDRAPAGMEIAAGEYGYTLPYFERMLAAGAVDCLQADVTRCEGITGFLRVAALCQARSLELSAHCGPSIHAASLLRGRGRCATSSTSTTTSASSGSLFDGALEPIDGALRPDLSAAGQRSRAQTRRRRTRYAA